MVRVEHGFCALPAARTSGAIEAIEMHASAALKDTYLPQMISGEWSGTMNLTEPQAGTDLAAIKTRAECDGDATGFAARRFTSPGASTK